MNVLLYLIIMYSNFIGCLCQVDSVKRGSCSWSRTACSAAAEVPMLKDKKDGFYLSSGTLGLMMTIKTVTMYYYVTMVLVFRLFFVIVFCAVLCRA